MIALAVFVMLLSSAELLSSGSGQGSYFSSEDELALAKEALIAARADARADFFTSMASSSETMRNGVAYGIALSATYATPCLLHIEAAAGKRSGTTTLDSYVGNAQEEEALGGDCEPLPLQQDWRAISEERGNDIAGAHGRALDALSGAVYVGVDIPPYLAVVDEESGALIPFTNNFALPAAPNALDAALIDGDPYVFAALDATSSQFAIIDMRDALAPSSRYFTLSAVDPAGESPEGYRVRYYGGYAYVVARYTAGPELHIFDVADPGAAYEIASAELGVTVNDVAVRDEPVGGNDKRLLYAASSDKPGELLIYDVTQPSRVARLSATDLPERTQTHHPGESIALMGSYALIGRSSGPNDPDLFIYDVSDAARPALVASADVGGTVSNIEAFGSVAFLGTSKSGRQVETWDVSTPSAPALAASYALTGLGARALDYDDGRLYAAGTAAPLLRALQSL
jgi:hypothetical protein